MYVPAQSWKNVFYRVFFCTEERMDRFLFFHLEVFQESLGVMLLIVQPLLPIRRKHEFYI